MTGKAGLKAGLIGAAIVVVLTLISQIPPTIICCSCTALTWLVYAAIGALAGFFLTPPRTAGTSAGAGAIAGLISGAASGLIWTIVIAIQVAVGDTGDIMSAIDPETMRQLTELGIDPETFAVFSGVGGGVMCCLTGLAAGAGLGAVGGAIFAAAKPD